mgnify:CR=1 FL=1
MSSTYCPVSGSIEVAGSSDATGEAAGHPAAVEHDGANTEQQLASFMKTGLISRELLLQPSVHTRLQQLRRDVMRFAGPVESIDAAISAADPRNMWANLRVVPPTSGSNEAPWTTLDSVSDQHIINAWTELVEGWQSNDVAIVNAQLNKLATLIPALARGAEFYPSPKKLQLEKIPTMPAEKSRFLHEKLIFLIQIFLCLKV